MENVSPIITAKNLNLWYGDFKALKDISLDMGEREITAAGFTATTIRLSSYTISMMRPFRTCFAVPDT